MPSGLPLRVDSLAWGYNLSGNLSSQSSPSTLTARVSSVYGLPLGTYHNSITVWDNSSGARTNFPVTFTVSESACRYTLSKTSATAYPTAGLSGNITVTRLPANCPLSVTSDANWLTVDVNQNWISYSVEANPLSAPRVGQQTF